MLVPSVEYKAERRSDGRYYLKLAFWRAQEGDLVVRSRPLRALTPQLAAEVPFGYEATGFQPVGAVFDARGCWVIEGTLGTQTLAVALEVS